MSVLSPYLSFIIPAYNEKSRISASLEKALDFFSIQSFQTEIIVVNDGSTDNTSELVRGISGTNTVLVKLIEQPRNIGKGAAVRRGMLDARGLYRLFSDADFSTPVYETSRILQCLNNGAEICIGSRGIDTSLVKKHQPFYREFIGNQFNVVIQALFTPGINDTQCGFKGFSARAAQEIFSRASLDGFAFDVEILYIARRLGYHIEEIAVEWYNDERSTVGFRHAWSIIRELLTIKRLHRHLSNHRAL